MNSTKRIDHGSYVYLHLHLFNVKIAYVDGSLNSETFENCANFQDTENFFLDAATAAADIDTFFAAEGQ